MPLLPFICARNLTDPAMSEQCPWDYAPDAAVLKMLRELPKDERRQRPLEPDFEWNVYTAVEGVNLSARISKENPPACVRGLVADFDTVLPVATIGGILRQMPAEFAPNFIEVSLGGKFRLIWVFEKSLLVTGSEHAAAIYKLFAQKFKIATLLPGFDKNSEKPAERWTNGGEWFEFRKDPLPWPLVFGMAVDASRAIKPTRADMPIEAVAAEAAKRWPGRWQGPFEVGALGVRFWDQTADNTTGCQVKPDGMLCFTGNVPFMKWEAIFGASWVNERRALNLAGIAEQIFFDGRAYHRPLGAAWYDCYREDVLLELASRGLDPSKQKGQMVSEAARVLHHIQTANRVHGAAPLIYCPRGIVEIGGLRILNTSTLKPIPPAAGKSTPADFPFLYKFHEGFLVTPPGAHPLWFLEARVRRAYLAVLDGKPMMGQAIFLCGPVNNGKTLWCFRIFAALLGGRTANPYRYLIGKTDFTDELFSAPVWAINDEEAPYGPERRAYLAKLKSCVVNPEITYHPKFAKKLSLPCQSNIIITANDGPASVGVLPEVNDETRDKMMFFSTQAYAGRWPERDELEAIINRELPHYGRYLLDWEPPAEVLEKKQRRMGVESYFDPRLLALSQQQAYCYSFCELLPVWAHNCPTFNTEIWEGNPTKLASEMHIVEAIAPMMRDWPVDKIANALNALARLGGLGVEFVEDTQGRVFRLKKSLLVKSSSPTSL
jgi:hypothetical protein